MYQVQLEQDQLKRELEEAKLQLEQVRLQTENPTSSSEEDERQTLGAYPKQPRGSKVIHRYNSMPILKNSEAAATRQSAREEKTTRPTPSDSA